MIKIERIIPYLMDGLAALTGGVVTTAVLGLLGPMIVDWTRMQANAAFLVIVTIGAFLAVRVARKSIRDQVHMELAEGGK